MLKSVFVINHHDERYELPLSNFEESGFLIKDISGMGPIATSINTSSGALSPGEFFNSSKIQPRNIVLNLLYYPDSGLIENQRRLGYKIFEVNTPIDIEFYTDKAHVVAHGYVETHEPVFFSEMCETSISIVCPDPFLYSRNEKIFSMSNLVRTFKFYLSPRTKPPENVVTDAAFKNPDPYDPPYNLDPDHGGDPRMDNTLMMGYYDRSSIKKLYNEGNASDIGMIIRVVVSADGLTGFTFCNLTNGKRIEFDDDVMAQIVPDGGLLPGDELIISSKRGDKHILVRRSGNVYNVLPAKVYSSDWVTLDSGENELYYYCNGGDNTADVSVIYTPAFLGV